MARRWLSNTTNRTANQTTLILTGNAKWRERMLQSHLTSIQSQGIVESDFGMSAHLLSTAPFANAYDVAPSYPFVSTLTFTNATFYSSSRSFTKMTNDFLTLRSNYNSLLDYNWFPFSIGLLVTRLFVFCLWTKKYMLHVVYAPFKKGQGGRHWWNRKLERIHPHTSAPVKMAISGWVVCGTRQRWCWRW